MSKKRVRRCCLVIDASVAGAAGPLESRHPESARCRDFLIAVRGICHRMAWNEALKREWDANQGAFARQWRLTMVRLKKLQPVREESLEPLRQAIAEHSPDQGVIAKMLKDAHLIDAALAADKRIASKDENARGHFGRLLAAYEPLRRIHWVNPANEAERVVEWLEAGAPLERARRLRP